VSGKLGREPKLEQTPPPPPPHPTPFPSSCFTCRTRREDARTRFHKRWATRGGGGVVSITLLLYLEMRTRRAVYRTKQSRAILLADRTRSTGVPGSGFVVSERERERERERESEGPSREETSARRGAEQRRCQGCGGRHFAPRVGGRRGERAAI